MSVLLISVQHLIQWLSITTGDNGWIWHADPLDPVDCQTHRISCMIVMWCDPGDLEERVRKIIPHDSIWSLILCIWPDNQTEPRSQIETCQIQPLVNLLLNWSFLYWPSFILLNYLLHMQRLDCNCILQYLNICSLEFAILNWFPQHLVKFYSVPEFTRWKPFGLYHTQLWHTVTFWD